MTVCIRFSIVHYYTISKYFIILLQHCHFFKYFEWFKFNDGQGPSYVRFSSVQISATKTKYKQNSIHDSNFNST